MDICFIEAGESLRRGGGKWGGEEGEIFSDLPHLVRMDDVIFPVTDLITHHFFYLRHNN